MNEVGWCYLEGFGCKKDKVRFYLAYFLLHFPSLFPCFSLRRGGMHASPTHPKPRCTIQTTVESHYDPFNMQQRRCSSDHASCPACVGWFPQSRAAWLRRLGTLGSNGAARPPCILVESPVLQSMPPAKHCVVSLFLPRLVALIEEV
jgi:hypothetical protein